VILILHLKWKGLVMSSYYKKNPTKVVEKVLHNQPP
jgi:hypothetical protein